MSFCHALVRTDKTVATVACKWLIQTIGAYDKTAALREIRYINVKINYVPHL